jgi:transposase
MKRASLSESERCLIFKWKGEGIIQKEIASRLSVSEGCVSYVLKNYTKDNMTNIMYLTGRMRLLNEDEIMRVQVLAENNRKISALKLVVQVQNEIGKEVGPKTIKRYLASNGVKARRCRKVPFITKINQKKGYFSQKNIF